MQFDTYSSLSFGNNKLTRMQDGRLRLAPVVPKWFPLSAGLLLLVFLWLLVNQSGKVGHFAWPLLLVFWIYQPLFLPYDIFHFSDTYFSKSNSDVTIPYSSILKVRLRRHFFMYEVDVYSKTGSFTLASFYNKTEAERLAQWLLGLKRSELNLDIN